MISNLQIRAARALLGWSQARLAEAAGVSVVTIKRLEASEQPFHARDRTVAKVRAAVEAAGVSFPKDADGYAHRVQLRARRPD